MAQRLPEKSTRPSACETFSPAASMSFVITAAKPFQPRRAGRLSVLELSRREARSGISNHVCNETDATPASAVWSAAARMLSVWSWAVTTPLSPLTRAEVRLGRSPHPGATARRRPPASALQQGWMAGAPGAPAMALRDVARSADASRFLPADDRRSARPPPGAAGRDPGLARRRVAVEAERSSDGTDLPYRLQVETENVECDH